MREPTLSEVLEEVRALRALLQPSGLHGTCGCPIPTGLTARVRRAGPGGEQATAEPRGLTRADESEAS